MSKPTVPEIVPLVRALIDAHDGCCWHNVLADGNVNARDVDDCARRADRRAHPDCIALIKPITAMSRTQRRKLSALAYGGSR